ncbi:MAG TPA: FMN-binding negative transcriptional regulator [Myxococcales bacterium]|nr:FMN-binding negative transcriptional regulator [Myxococcales bacterium]
MYLPEPFRIDDREALLAHAAANAFATLITHQRDGMQVSHVPLLLDPVRDVVCGHLARNNPQVAHLAAGAEALAIFHGPHAYVSPSVYEQHPAVPTWNYVVVHARGRGRLVEEDRLRRILDEMVARFDDTGWKLDGPEEFVRKQLAAIAGFEIGIEALEGKWKLSQNRPLADQARVAEWLERGGEQSRAVAALMRDRLRRGPAAP